MSNQGWGGGKRVERERLLRVRYHRNSAADRQTTLPPPAHLLCPVKMEHKRLEILVPEGLQSSKRSYVEPTCLFNLQLRSWTETRFSCANIAHVGIFAVQFRAVFFIRRHGQVRRTAETPPLRPIMLEIDIKMDGKCLVFRPDGWSQAAGTLQLYIRMQTLMSFL